MAGIFQLMSSRTLLIAIVVISSVVFAIYSIVLSRTGPTTHAYLEPRATNMRVKTANENCFCQAEKKVKCWAKRFRLSDGWGHGGGGGGIRG